MRKARFAALVVSVLALLILPAGSTEVATPNDTARFLAGLPPGTGSPLAALSKDPSWERHANYFDLVFGKVDQTHLSKIREFSSRHAHAGQSTSATSATSGTCRGCSDGVKDYCVSVLASRKPM